MVRLGDVGKVITGNTPKTSDLQNYTSNDICFVKPSDIADGTVAYLDGSEFYISEYARAKARILPPKSVLVTCIGIIGKVAINNVECAFNQQINAIIPDNSKCLTEYLAYAVQNKQPEMQDIANAPVVPILNKTQFSDIKIKLPSLTDQEEVADKLNIVSWLISLRQEQLAKLDELVKSRFIELFGLPVSNSKGWNTEKMREIAPAVNYSGGFEDAVWLLNLDMVEAQTGRILDYLYVNEEEVGNSTCTFDTTNVLYSKLRPYLNKVVIPDRCGYATSELIPLKPNPMKLERTYLAFMLRSDEFVNMINEKVAGAKMPRVSMSDFREFDVPVPPMELQKQFDAFVEQTDKSKLVIQESLAELVTLKKALMQKYFG